MASKIRLALIRLLPRLTRFGRALTGSRADGDDLVQAAVERALTREVDLGVVGRLDAWMYRVMRNLWVDEIRARQVRQNDQDEVLDSRSGEDGVGHSETMLALAAVRRALTELPAEQRTVLMLVCVDGLSYKETAEAIDAPVGTVMSRLARGRQALYDKIEETPDSQALSPK